MRLGLFWLGPPDLGTHFHVNIVMEADGRARGSARCRATARARDTARARATAKYRATARTRDTARARSTALTLALLHVPHTQIRETSFHKEIPKSA